jgi:hypothetical protein
MGCSRLNIRLNEFIRAANIPIAGIVEYFPRRDLKLRKHLPTFWYRIYRISGIVFLLFLK